MKGRIQQMDYFNYEEAREMHKRDWEAAAAEHGDIFAIPKQLKEKLAERDRARMCAITNPSWSVKELVSYYSIDQRVAAEIFGVDQVEPEKKVKRSDKYDAIFSWCQDNVFAQVSPNEIAELGEISYPTALKLVNDRPDIFRKIKRGLFEIRDPKADREAEKK